jgi:hypothetical protein
MQNFHKHDAQKPLPPSQSIGCLSKPAFISRRLMEPNLDSICLIPIAPTNGGIIIGSSIRPENKPLPLNLCLLITSASGTARQAVINVTTIPNMKLFVMDSLRIGLVNIYLKKTTENPPLK